jgi:CAAX protease family protein
VISAPANPAPIRPFFRALLFILIAVTAVQTSEFLTSQIGHAGWVAPRYERFVFYLIVNTALLLVSGLMLVTVDRRSFRALGLWFYSKWVQEASIGVGFGASLIAAVAGVMLAGRWLSYEGLSANLTLAGFLRVAVFLLLAAACEEILFRGYAFQRLVDALGPLGAIVLSSALFGLGHYTNPAATALSTANTVLAGVVLSVAYLKTRGLWLPIGLHFGWNFFLGPVCSLPISGFQMRPMLLRSHIAGPAWLTGAQYGPEGSILLTVACVAAIAWLARTKRVFASPAMQEVLK